MRILMVFLSTLMLFGFAHAHRQPEMVSTVEYVIDADGKAVTQITHRIHAHDAMKVIGLWPAVSAANLDDEALLGRLAQALLGALDMSVEGKLVGYEVEGNYFFAFEEVSGHADLRGGRGLSMLSEAWTHRVNLAGKLAGVKSYTFSVTRGTKVSPETAAP